MPSSLPAHPEQRQAVLAEFIDGLVAELEPLYRSHNEAVWLANVTGEPAHVTESGRLDAEIRGRYARKESFERLRGLRDSGGVPDPLLARQLTVLLNLHHAHQIPPETIQRMVALEKSLETRFNRFRARLGDRAVTDNDLRDVLRRSDDPGARKTAWEASKQVGAEVAEELKDLVRLRNGAARDLGFRDYFAMGLGLDELREDELFELLDDLERRTGPMFHAYKGRLDESLARRFSVVRESLRPWHYADPFFQEAPATGFDLDPYFTRRPLTDLARDSFRAVGFDIDDLLARADLEERPGKCQHAFCMSVDRGADVRVLCNLKPNELWMGTLLHEMGHAVYDQAIDRTLPFFLRVPAHTLTTEASAMLFGRLSKNPAWLRKHARVDAAEAERVRTATGRAIREQLLVLTRWCLVMVHMERALYRDPDADLDTLWWDLVERFQEVRRPDGRKAPDWASKIHFSVAPVYYHNYLLGEIMASQTQAHLLEAFGGASDEGWDRFVSSPEVGERLRRGLYAYGKSVDWREATRRATGAPLSTAAFVEDLASGHEVPQTGRSRA